MKLYHDLPNYAIHDDCDAEPDHRRAVPVPLIDAPGIGTNGSHPAPYTYKLLPVMAEMLRGCTYVLDPMAGTGRVFLLENWLPDTQFEAIELEPEFAAMHPRTRVGNALHLPWPDDTFDGICVSPVYGNRMCLPGGTLVLTRDRGYVPIESIRAGELVLSHTGAWRRVLWAGQTGIRETVRLTAQGPGQLQLTGNHRLPLRRNTRTWQPVKLGECEWREASTVEPMRDYLCLSTKTPKGETPKVPLAQGAAAWWAIGFWLGNGWGYYTEMPNGAWRRAKVSFCKDEKQADLYEPKLRAAFGDKVRRLKHVQGGTVRWAVYSQELLKWLYTHFGKGSADKRVPGWVLNLSDDERAALLEGWLDADGCPLVHGGRKYRVGTSVNRPLIRMMQTVAHSLGYSTSYHQSKEARREMVAGCMCDVQSAYQLRVTRGKTRRVHSLDDGDWTVIRDVETDPIAQPVYDLHVETDNSFVAEGVVVHNSDQDVPKKGYHNTYRFRLGRDLHPDNAGRLQWGSKYRDLHTRAWTEARRVLQVGGVFVLNCKNHIRAGRTVHVTEWHIECLEGLGFRVARHERVDVPGLRDGKNAHLRVPYESVVRLVLERK